MPITITNARPEHWQALEELQKVCYPTLHADELLRVEHFASHYRLFPEGQQIALDGEQVVGMSTTFRSDIDFAHPDHTFYEIIAGGFFTNHKPQGALLYGADISVHPEHRRRGIASQLYDARKQLIKRLDMQGMVAGGMIPGYRFHCAEMSVEAYVSAVVAGALSDPALTPQLRNGFVVRGVLHDYLRDALLGNDATLIAWFNPDYRPIVQ